MTTTVMKALRVSVVIFLILVAMLLALPSAAFAEGESEAVGSSTTSEGFDTGGFEAGGAGFNAAPDTSFDFGGGPAADLSTPISGFDNAASSPGAPAPETDVPPASPTLDQQNGLQEPTPSSNTDTGDESGETVGLAIEATTGSAGSSLDQLGASPTPAAGSDSGAGLTTETGASNQTQYFQVVEESMNPLFLPGSIVEIVSESYAEGDVVVAQKSDGTYIIKMLVGDQLVSLSAGTTYTVADVTILGAVAPSAMSQAELESGGIAWNIAMALISTPPAAGDGLPGNPYQIATWQNLYWLSQNRWDGEWTANFIQTENITFPAEIAGWDENAGWMPIGREIIGEGWVCFSGSYNGQGKTISNLFIERGADGQGLFGYTVGATLTNIALVDVDVTGANFVGGLVGYNVGGTISNSSATGEVTGDGYVGGLVGYNNGGSISNSSADGAVTGLYDVGGLVGKSNNGNISNSSATAAVTGANFVGGLVGKSDNGNISNSYATGAVTGLNSVGGLVGNNYSGTITNSYATGAVTGTGDSVGGLVGDNRGTISNSYATGEVTGDGYVGGLVGINFGGTISNSSADGAVTGNWSVGGLVGINNDNGTISDSYATGDVEGPDNIGGLIGINHGSVYSSFASGNVVGKNWTGGLVGLNSARNPETPSAVIRNCYATGNVTGEDYVGGLVGRNGYSDVGFPPLQGIVQNSYAVGLVLMSGGGDTAGGLIGYSAVGSIVENSFYDQQTSNQNDTGKGTPKLTSEMQTLTTYLNAEWDISGEDGSYPVLGWQVDWTETIWYMGTPPDDNGDDQGGGSGGNFGGNLGADFDSSGFTFTLPPLPVTGSALTAISGKGANPIITPAFVTGGSAADLGSAIAAYDQAKQSFEANKGTMGAADKAVAEVELAIANAAIKALELSLAAQGGQAFDMAALISAYNNAVAVLNANRALLTAEQLAAAEALLQAIATVISKYST